LEIGDRRLKDGIWETGDMKGRCEKGEEKKRKETRENGEGIKKTVDG
jgi:hypothetical protein